MKVLVAFGTKMGGTEGIAEAIGGRLRSKGWSVDVCAAATDPDTSGYDAVIVGGALYVRRWHKAAARFVRSNAAPLRRVPVWLFSSGPLDESAHDGEIAPVPQVAKLMAKVDARGHATFGGRLPEDAEGFMARRMARTQAGDWRDFSDITLWADAVAADLEANPEETPASSGVGQ